ncbi:MAG: type I glutamate--ammonia ligase [bacterium]|nr:type I glutamate--ammonia ligase [bacterium]
MMTKEDVLAAVKEHGIRFIDLWFTDITGVVKSMTIPTGQLERAIERGTHFDGSSIDGFARVAESDMVLMPDPNTFALLPWERDTEPTARLICAIYTPQGEPFIGCPRGALIRVLRQAEAQGYRFKTGIEMEFFLFKTDAAGNPITSTPTDQASYFDMSTDEAQVIRRKMLIVLEAMGIRVDSAHSEIGYGQHEIDFHYNDALTSADQILTARVALKAVAQRHGLYCTFMPRPSADLPGSGMHTHQSLHNISSDENLFVDAGHEYGLSEIARFFLAGQLCHARAMTAVLSPLVNSYKRLGTSFEAPMYVSWAHINRAALIRVPSMSAGMESHTRLELRSPDPSSNPYLATAVMLQAGLDGIQQGTTLPAPLEETLLTQNRSRLRQVEMLPLSLGEALDALSQSDVILAALGPYISDRYLSAKRQELDEYNRQVTQWEIDRYLPRY